MIVARAALLVAVACGAGGCRLLGFFADDVPCTPEGAAAQCASGTCSAGRCIAADAGLVAPAACGGPRMVVDAFDDREAALELFELSETADIADGALLLPMDRTTNAVAWADGRPTFDLRGGEIVVSARELPSAGSGELRLAPLWSQFDDAIILSSSSEGAQAYVFVGGQDVGRRRVDVNGLSWRIRERDGDLDVEQLVDDEWQSVLHLATPAFADAVNVILTGDADEGAFVVEAVNPGAERAPACPARTLPADVGLRPMRSDGCTISDGGGGRILFEETTTNPSWCGVQTKLPYDLQEGAFFVDVVASPAAGLVFLEAKGTSGGDDVSIDLQAFSDRVDCSIKREGQADERYSTALAAGDVVRGLRIRSEGQTFFCEYRTTTDGPFATAYDGPRPFDFGALHAAFGADGDGPFQAEVGPLRGE